MLITEGPEQAAQSPAAVQAPAPPPPPEDLLTFPTLKFLLPAALRLPMTDVATNTDWKVGLDQFTQLIQLKKERGLHVPLTSPRVSLVNFSLTINPNTLIK